MGVVVVIVMTAVVAVVAVIMLSLYHQIRQENQAVNLRIVRDSIFDSGNSRCCNLCCR